MLGRLELNSLLCAWDRYGTANTCQCYKCTACSWQYERLLSLQPSLTLKQAKNSRTIFCTSSSPTTLKHILFKLYETAVNIYHTVSCPSERKTRTEFKRDKLCWCTHRSPAGQHMRRKISTPCLILQEQKCDKLLLKTATKLIHWTKTGETLTSFSQILCKCSFTVFDSLCPSAC